MTCSSKRGHYVTVSIGDQAYQISGFSMTIANKSTTSSYNWEVSTQKSIYYTDSSTSTVTFSVGSNGYLTYSVSQGTASPPVSSAIIATANLQFICNVL